MIENEDYYVSINGNKYYYEDYVKSLREVIDINHKIIDMYISKIYQVIEDLKNTLKYNMKHKDIRGNEYVDMDIDHIQMLIDMLEEVKGNE